MALPEKQVFAVADGMGGHARGEVAAQIAIDTVISCFEYPEVLDELDPAKQRLGIEPRIRTALQLANRRVFEAAQLDLASAGMGTTMVAAFVEGQTLCIAHVGDSRAYRIRRGAIERMTVDHSLFEELRTAATLSTVVPPVNLDDPARFSLRNVITRALGVRPQVRVDTRLSAIQNGDMLVLCSDGLSGMIDDRTILNLVRESSDIETALDGLISAANAAGGDDNITAVLVQFLL